MQPNQSITPATKRRLPKKLLLVGLGVIVVLAIALGTVALLSRLTPSKQANTQTQQESAAKTAKQKLKEAQTNEAEGEIDAALTAYKEALAAYQVAGDKAGAEAVKLQITYLESVKNNTLKTKDVTTDTDPTKDPGYGKQLPR